MITLSLRTSAAIHRYLRHVAPTNIAVAWLRSPHGSTWAIPIGLMLSIGYLHASSFCAVIVESSGPGWVNLLAILFFWNSQKFVWVAIFGMRRVPLIVSRADHRKCRRGPRRNADPPGNVGPSFPAPERSRRSASSPPRLSSVPASPRRIPGGLAS